MNDDEFGCMDPSRRVPIEFSCMMRYSRSDIVCILVSVVLAVAGGVGSAEPHKEIGVWFFGVGAVILMAQPWLRQRRSNSAAAKERVEFDEQEIRRFLPDGKTESIRWDELHEIGIVTTDEGPWVDDVFWLFLNADSSKGCAASNDAVGFPALLERLQRLPGFNDEAVVQAMGSTVNDRFVVWRHRVENG